MRDLFSRSICKLRANSQYSQRGLLTLRNFIFTKRPLSQADFEGEDDRIRDFPCRVSIASMIHQNKNHKTQFDHLYEQMLALIKDETVTLRPNRAEPRKKKFRGQKYARLTEPRAIEKSLIRKSRITLLS